MANMMLTQAQGEWGHPRTMAGLLDGDGGRPYWTNYVHMSPTDEWMAICLTDLGLTGWRRGAHC